MAAVKFKPLEKHIQAQWLALLRMNGILHWRYAVSALPHSVGGKIRFKPNPLAGFPDTCGITPKGKFWAAEIKREGGKLTELQKKWLIDLTEAHVLTRVIYSYEDSLAFLKEILDN